MKKIIIILIASAVLLFSGCFANPKAAAYAELKTIFQDYTKVFDDSTKDLDTATDGKTAAAAVIKFADGSKEYADKVKAFSDKYKDVKFTGTDLPLELLEPYGKFTASALGFSTAILKAATAYASDPDFQAAMQKYDEVNKAKNQQ